MNQKLFFLGFLVLVLIIGVLVRFFLGIFLPNTLSYHSMPWDYLYYGDSRKRITAKKKKKLRKIKREINADNCEQDIPKEFRGFLFQKLLIRKNNGENFYIRGSYWIYIEKIDSEKKDSTYNICVDTTDDKVVLGKYHSYKEAKKIKNDILSHWTTKSLYQLPEL